MGPGLGGSHALQEEHARHHLPAVLLPADDGQARAEEAQDRGPLGGALQEAPHWHGEQDHAAAAQSRRAGVFSAGAPGAGCLGLHETVVRGSPLDLTFQSQRKK